MTYWHAKFEHAVADANRWAGRCCIIPQAGGFLVDGHWDSLSRVSVYTALGRDWWMRRPGWQAQPKVERWVVRARAWGGVTGTRESLCKSNDETLYFATEDEARAYAEKRDREMNTPFACAFYAYWPEPYFEG